MGGGAAWGNGEGGRRGKGEEGKREGGKVEWKLVGMGRRGRVWYEYTRQPATRAKKREKKREFRHPPLPPPDKKPHW